MQCSTAPHGDHFTRSPPCLGEAFPVRDGELDGMDAQEQLTARRRGGAELDFGVERSGVTGRARCRGASTFGDEEVAATSPGPIVWNPL